MKKLLSALLVLAMLVVPMLALATEIKVEGAYTDGVYVGTGNGYLGEWKVEVTVQDGKMTQIKVLETVDTPDIYAKAVDEVIPAIIAANTVTGVDVQSGATFSSQGILEGVANALAQAGATVAAPEKAEKAEVEPLAATEGTIYHGLGSVPNFRVGPGKDSADVQVYSFNVAMASVLFDADGRILDMNVDIYEVSTPNYDGASMPHFSGWPEKEGYNVTDHDTAQVSGVSENTLEAIQNEVNGWQTKRERGATYGMNAQNEWFQQMDAYEKMFVGKTVEEMRAWFTKYTSERNGRPVKPTSEHEDDIAALAEMTEEDIALLTDVVSTATMSLSDSHGLILEAVEKAYANRVAAIEVGAAQ